MPPVSNSPCFLTPQSVCRRLSLPQRGRRAADRSDVAAAAPPMPRLERFRPLGRCPSWVNRVGFAMSALHPLISRKRPYSGHWWMSQKCQKETSPARSAGLTSSAASRAARAVAAALRSTVKGSPASTTAARSPSRRSAGPTSSAPSVARCTITRCSSGRRCGSLPGGHLFSESRLLENSFTWDTLGKGSAEDGGRDLGRGLKRRAAADRDFLARDRGRFFRKQEGDERCDFLRDRCGARSAELPRAGWRLAPGRSASRSRLPPAPRHSP